MSQILIVDDNSTNRDLLKAVLSGAESEYILIEADSGLSALKAVEKNMPDIILLDIMMPVMDGFEVCKKLKENKKFNSIPVLFITAMENAEDKVKGFDVGAADYITKPFNPDEVNARVNAHLKIKESENNRIETENLKTVKGMIATYNHNMNQPLMTIYTYIEVLLGNFDEADRTAQTLKKMKKELDKVNGILKKIQSIDTVKRTDYLGDSSMIDLGSDDSAKN